MSDLRSSLSEPHHVEDSDWGFARLPSLDDMFAAVQQGQGSPFLSRLQSSRTFNSPDCASSMAEVYRIGNLLEGLKVRLDWLKWWELALLLGRNGWDDGQAPLPQGISSASGGVSEEALEELRELLKLGIRAAWSQEAVRRGVAAAKVPVLHIKLTCSGTFGKNMILHHVTHLHSPCHTILLNGVY